MRYYEYNGPLWTEYSMRRWLGYFSVMLGIGMYIQTVYRRLIGFHVFGSNWSTSKSKASNVTSNERRTSICNLLIWVKQLVGRPMKRRTNVRRTSIYLHFRVESVRTMYATSRLYQLQRSNISGTVSISAYSMTDCKTSTLQSGARSYERL